jgi:antitoxin ParD1/3/4
LPEIHKVSVALTGEQVAALKAAVDAGEYATTSEIVREAIRYWQLRRELRQDDIQLLRQLWSEGKNSGSPRQVDFDKVKNSARKRAAHPHAG